MSHGFVYAMANAAFPDLLKIGHTTKAPDQRALELSRATGVPQPFVVLAFYAHENPAWLEAYMHQELAAYRSNERREFFKCELSQLGDLDFVSQIHITPDGCTQLVREITVQFSKGLPVSPGQSALAGYVRPFDWSPETYWLKQQGFDIDAYVRGKPQLRVVGKDHA